MLTEFRQAHLPRGCIRPDNVVSWFTTELYDAFGDSMFVEIDLAGPELLETEGRDLLYVNFRPQGGGPNDQRVLGFPVPEGSGLVRHLHQLVFELGARFGWRQADVVDFVLADETPPFRRIRTRFAPASVGAPPVTSRLLLSVDPTTHPDALMAVYRVARSRVTLRGRRHRLAPKTYELAWFAASRGGGEGWDRSMMRWNIERGANKYADVRRFRRDVTTARRRVLFPPLRGYFNMEVAGRSIEELLDESPAPTDDNPSEERSA